MHSFRVIEHRGATLRAARISPSDITMARGRRFPAARVFLSISVT
jgi:hypothetical protein